MTDVEYAHLQSEIFQMWKDDEDKMLEKLGELNHKYLEESEVYQKNQKEKENFMLGLKEGSFYSPNMGFSENLFWVMLMLWMFNGNSNNEPHTENKKTAFLNGKISAYEKVLRERE